MCRIVIKLKISMHPIQCAFNILSMLRFKCRQLNLHWNDIIIGHIGIKFQCTRFNAHSIFFQCAVQCLRLTVRWRQRWAVMVVVMQLQLWVNVGAQVRLANKCVNTSMLVFLTQGASDSRCECRCDDLALLDALGGWLGFLDVFRRLCDDNSR